MISNYAGRRFWSLLLICFGLIVLNSRGAEMLQWEGENGQVLFTVKDIVRFDWERQVFELKREAELDLWAYTDWVLDRKFIVRDAVGIIYEGHFVSGYSSKSYSGPVMRIGQGLLWAISDGYHPYEKQQDLRFATRLKEDLEKAGVLKAIAENEKLLPPPIETVMTEWMGDDLAVRAEIFPLQIGEFARLHLLFKEKKDLAIDSVEIVTTLSQDSGFSHTTDHSITEKFNGDVIRKGYKIIHWKPWTPAFGNPEMAKPGPATFEVTVVLRQKTAEGEKVLYSIKLPKLPVEILAPATSKK